MTGRDDAFALLQHPQHLATDRRQHGHALALAVPHLCLDRGQQLSLCAFELRRPHGEARPRRLDRGGTCPEAAQGTVEVALGNGLSRAQAFHASELGFGELRFRHCLLELGPGVLQRRLCGGDHRAGLCFGAQVEERRVDRFDLGDDRLAGNHGIAGLRLDAQHASGYRRRHDVHVTHPGLCLFIDRNAEFADRGGGEIDQHRHRAQAVGDGRDHHDGDGGPQDKARASCAPLRRRRCATLQA